MDDRFNIDYRLVRSVKSVNYLHITPYSLSLSGRALASAMALETKKG